MQNHRTEMAEQPRSAKAMEPTLAKPSGTVDLIVQDLEHLLESAEEIANRLDRSETKLFGSVQYTHKASSCEPQEGIIPVLASTIMCLRQRIDNNLEHLIHIQNRLEG
jgi:hypothetical protein